MAAAADGPYWGHGFDERMYTDPMLGPCSMPVPGGPMRLPHAGCMPGQAPPPLGFGFDGRPPMPHNPYAPPLGPPGIPGAPPWGCGLPPRSPSWERMDYERQMAMNRVGTPPMPPPGYLGERSSSFAGEPRGYFGSSTMVSPGLGERMGTQASVLPPTESNLRRDSSWHYGRNLGFERTQLDLQDSVTERGVTLQREVPRVVPKRQIVELRQEVPRPEIQYVDKTVEVPEIQYVEKIVEVPQLQIQEVVKPVPKVEIREVVREIPRYETQVVEKFVDVPQVEYRDRIVEVPQVQYVEKIVEVPQVRYQEVVRHVPKFEVQEVVRHVPRYDVQTIERMVEVPEIQYVEKTVEVPQVHYEEVVRHVPRVEVQEKIRHVPKYEVQFVERVVEVPEVQYVEKVVEVPQVHYQEVIKPVPKVEVQELVKTVHRPRHHIVERSVEVPVPVVTAVSPPVPVPPPVHALQAIPTQQMVPRALDAPPELLMPTLNTPVLPPLVVPPAPSLLHPKAPVPAPIIAEGVRSPQRALCPMPVARGIMAYSSPPVPQARALTGSWRALPPPQAPLSPMPGSRNVASIVKAPALAPAQAPAQAPALQFGGNVGAIPKGPVQARVLGTSQAYPITTAAANAAAAGSRPESSEAIVQRPADAGSAPVGSAPAAVEAIVPVAKSDNPFDAIDERRAALAKAKAAPNAKLGADVSAGPSNA